MEFHRETIYKKLIRFGHTLFHVSFDLSTPEGREKERHRRIALTAAMSVVAKVLAAAVPLVTIRVAYVYMGSEIFGLWTTVTSFFTFFTFADMGLGSGLQTQLSGAIGRQDQSLCRRLVTTTAVMLGIIALVLTIIYLTISPVVNWNLVMNVSGLETAEITFSVISAIIFTKIIALPLTIATRTQMAYQEGYISYFWDALGSVGGMIVIYIISKTALGPLCMIWASSLASIIIPCAKAINYFGVQRREVAPQIKNFDSHLLRKLLRLGLSFASLSILTTIGLSLDTYIVGKFINLIEAGQYSILYKASQFIGIGCSMLSAPLWSANGEAFARGDYIWVRKTAWRMTFISTALSICAILVLTLFATPIFSLLAGNEFIISMPTLIGICIMQMLFSFISPWFMVLNAKGVVKQQIICFALFTVASLSTKMLLISTFGLPAIPWTSVTCYVVVIIPWIMLRAHHVLVQQERLQTEQRTL